MHGLQRRPGLLRNQPVQRHYRTDMNTSQLQCIISCDPVLRDDILGVFAADHLPSVLPATPCGFIVNTDISSRPGTHWLALFVRDNTVDFFDSYGQSPRAYDPSFTRWIYQRGLRARINRKRMQSDFSNVCGLYCLYFLRQRLLGRSMTQIVEQFDTTNLGMNDRNILDVFRRVYAYCVQNDCVYNQMCKPLLRYL